jgi:iron complex outermembrane receptor protein
VRYPTVEEHTNIPFGDEPGLKTQQGVSVEAGIEINQSNNRYRLTTYRLELDDEIAFDSSGFYNLNLDSTKRQGLIIETFSQWTTRLNSTLSLTLLDSEISSGAFKGNQLPLVPEQSLRLDSRYQLDKAWLLGIELILVEDQVLGGDFANQLDKLPSYTLVNGVVNWQGNQLDVQFRINNLLDEKYSETGSQYTDYSAFPSLSYFESYFPSPERNISLSLKYSF